MGFTFFYTYCFHQAQGVNKMTREAHYVNQTPYGICTRCKVMALIRVDGIPQCPKCDTKSIPSGRTNNMPDLGQEYMKKLVKKDKDGNPYDEWVPDTAKIERDVKAGRIKDPSIERAPNLHIPKKENEEALHLARERQSAVPGSTAREQSFIAAPQPVGVIPALAYVKKYFEAAPVKDAAQFKQLQKIRKAIDKLNLTVTEYIGGNRNDS